MQPGAGLLSYSGWGISLEWSEDEQRILENCMARFPADRMDPVQRYVRIAAALPRKCVRDVALRVRWTMLQQQLKRRTGLDAHRPTPVGIGVGGGMGLPPVPPPKPIMSLGPPHGAALSSYGGPAAMGEGPPTIEGPIAHLLDANLAILNHFRGNMAAFKVHENTQLLVQFRDNILQILNAMEAMGGVMSQMPSLPVRLNIDLANNFLPSRPAGILSYDGMVLPPPPQPALNAPGMVPVGGAGMEPGAGQPAATMVHTLPKPPLGLGHPLPQPLAVPAMSVGPQSAPQGHHFVTAPPARPVPLPMPMHAGAPHAQAPPPGPTAVPDATRAAVVSKAPT